MKKRNIRNALGGTYTDAESESISRNFTRIETENRLDTNRAIVTKAYNVSNYNIVLLYSGEVIEHVGVINPPDSPFLVGKEVMITYPHGLRQQPIIIGGSYTPNPGDTSTGGTTRIADLFSDQRGAMAATMISGYFEMLKISSIILSDDLAGRSQDTDRYLNLFPYAKIHSALTGDELHDPKPDVNHRVQSLRLNVVDWDDRAGYENEGTIVVFDTGIQNSVRIYLNSAWHDIDVTAV